MLLIGIRGIIGAGKTTIARELNSRLTNSRIISFADPIKAYLKAVGITKEEHLDLYRRSAQFIGASCRAKDEDHWVKLYKNQIINQFEENNNTYSLRKIINAYDPDLLFDIVMQSSINDKQIIITDDVRYYNEVDIFRDVGYLVNVNREGLDTKKPEYQHESEIFNLSNPNKTLADNLLVENNGTVNEAVNAIIKGLNLQSYLRKVDNRNIGDTSEG